MSVSPRNLGLLVSVLPSYIHIFQRISENFWEHIDAGQRLAGAGREGLESPLPLPLHPPIRSVLVVSKTDATKGPRSWHPESLRADLLTGGAHMVILELPSNPMGQGTGTLCITQSAMAASIRRQERGPEALWSRS